MVSPGIVAAGVILVFVFVVLCYLMIKLGSDSKMGRRVEVRVRSCEQKGGEANRLYYEMQVELYGENGEVLVRTMQSAKKYIPGDVVRCRYLEQRGLLFEEMAPEVRKKSRNNVLLFLVIFLIFIGCAVVLAVKGIPDDANILVGYGISILFLAAGVFGIYQKGKWKQNMQDMMSLPGMQVDYMVGERTDTEGRTVLHYNPVYEYEWGGERRRIVGSVGGSGKKYRSIGTRVHILVDPHTGKAVCQENEMAKGNMYILFGAIGLIVFILMLGISFGVLS